MSGSELVKFVPRSFKVHTVCTKVPLRAGPTLDPVLKTLLHIQTLGFKPGMSVLYPHVQGRIHDFLKKGASKSEMKIPTCIFVSGPNEGLTELWRLWGQGVSEGDVPPQVRRKTVIFKVILHDLMHSFLPGAHGILNIYLEFCAGRPHKLRRPISAKNREGARRLRPL